MRNKSVITKIDVVFESVSQRRSNGDRGLTRRTW